ncbi:MAG: DUF4340 domain-containing protein [Treponema sp.]|nr:DUF4340 domain-containing protein [Treponema sp.]
MKTRKLILIIADVVLLAVCILQGVLSGRDGVVNFTCSDDIDEFVFESPAESFTIVKDGENWFGGEKKYPLTTSTVEDFVEQISSIRALDKVGSLGNSNAAERYELDDGHKISVTAKKDGKVLRTLLIGKEASASSQAYIAIDDKKDIYLASGNIRSTFDTTLTNIRSRTVWQLDKATITSVTLRKFEGSEESPDQVFTISKMGAGEDIVWNISPAEIQVDSEKAQDWFDSFATISTPVWHGQGEDLGGKKIVEAEVVAGFKTAKLSLYEIAAESEDANPTYYAESSESPYVFELASYSVGKFLKKAEDFAK